MAPLFKLAVGREPAVVLEPHRLGERKQALDGEPVEVDTEIVPLMRLLWEHDFDTSLSCQADPEAGGRVWVEFWGPSAEQFVQLVGRANPGLAARMLPCEDRYDGDWLYSTLPHPLGDGELAFTISLFFPRSDLAAVVAALEQAREPVALLAGVARGLVRFVAAHPWSIGYFAAVVTTILVGLVAGWLDDP